MTPAEHIAAIRDLLNDLSFAVEQRAIHQHRGSADDMRAFEGLGQTATAALDQIDFHARQLREALQ